MTKPSVDKADIRLENTLLTNEVRRLRAELADTRRQLRNARERITELQGGGGEGGVAVPGGEDMTPRARRIRKLETEALDDMHWLINRIDHSPVGALVRRREGFRTLKQRYGADPRA